MIRSQSYCCFRGIITIYFLFSLLLLLNTFASPTRSLCRRDQRDALLELQKEFSIPTLSDSWNKSLDCCSWWAVTCDAKLGEVISLQLSSYTTKPANTFLKSSSGLFKLQHLRNLELSGCNLQGEIPSSIGNLSNLTSLDLSSNTLAGEVPASIGNLNQLRFLSLGSNHLRGNLPTSFANLTKLSILYIGTNQFTGGETVLANLTSLSDIDFSHNHFTSSLSIYLSGLHNLEGLIGNDNSFVGPFPSSLLTIPSLRLIDLSQNQFQGPIDFGNTSSTSKLSRLVLTYNKFDGLIPESISKLRNLVSLEISHNNFGGRVPRSLSKLVNLSNLYLSYNNLEGQVPYFLWRSSSLSIVELSHNSFSSFGKSVEVVDGASLQVLDLGSNSLQGPFPQWICKLTSLYALVLPNNQFTGSIPQCLKNSTSLSDLNLRNNSLSGSLDFNSTELRSLDVSRNNLVGKLPKSLNNCMSMQLLNVGGNKINDTFPFWLGSLEVLMVLVLRSNEFYGPVYNPTVHLGFPSMRIIDISNNNFVGSLPQDYFAKYPLMSEVWNGKGDYMLDYLRSYEDSVDLVYKGVDTDIVRILIDFKAVDFSGNRFCGDIPGSIGLLSNVRLLNLSGNAFKGHIPPSLANITNLETLDLSRNNLSGEIPRGLGNLSFLSYMNFSHNHLEGLVPQSKQFETQKCSSFMGNPGLYGLEKICGGIHFPVPTSQQPEESLSEPEEPVLNWIAAAIAYVPGVFCGLVIGHIFTSYKHEWLMVKFGRNKPKNIIRAR